MSKRTVSGITLTLLLIGMITLAFKIQAVNATGTVYIRADGSIDPSSAPISSADNVTYTLIDNIISDADGIIVERDNIVIDGAGYTVRGSFGPHSKGITLSERSNVTIMDIVIVAFSYGVWLSDSSKNSISGIDILENSNGIELDGSSENIISGNNIWCVGLGISFSDSLNNSLLGNNITAKKGWGIELVRSSNSTLRNNIIVNSMWSLGVDGYSLSHFIQDIDVSNTVDGKPVYYWVNKLDTSIPVNAGYVGLVNCTRITVKNLDLKNNDQNVLLAYTTNTNITENNITDNWKGIWLYGSHDNFVSGNNITNSLNGLFLEVSYNNIISGNTFENNGWGIEVYDSFNNSLLGNNIANNNYGIQFNYYSSNNIVSGNSVTASLECGINLYGSNNIVSENNVTDNKNSIIFDLSSNNTLLRNNIANNVRGILFLRRSTNNTISRNNIANNNYGISFSETAELSSNNFIYHNNIANNTQQAYADNTINTWDNGYPSGGNYWSDYNRTDLYSGPYQNETGSDGIGDTPYEVDANNRDNYPLIEPWTPIIKATVDIYPQALKLRSTNRWITAYIELQKRYSVRDINVSTIMLNGTISVELDILPEIGDYDNDIIPDLKITFNRTALCEFILAKGIMTGNVTLTITGKLCDGTPFEPTTVTKVRMPGDVNIDGKVDGKDIALVSKAFGSYPNHPRWNPVADENEDNKIEGKDIALIAKNYGKTYI